VTDAATRRFIRARANDRCEYCGIPQHALDQSLQIEHIVARQHLGGDDLQNLALACDRCNLHKGPNLSAVDEESGRVVPLFHPRHDTWSDHFELHGPEIVGRTDIGRATVRLLQMNSRWRMQLRDTLLALGQW
jgi:hypothetical protein